MTNRHPETAGANGEVQPGEIPVEKDNAVREQQLARLHHLFRRSNQEHSVSPLFLCLVRYRLDQS